MDIINFPIKSENNALIRLTEECGEVVQAVSKYLRFGAEGKDHEGNSNLDLLLKELYDLDLISSIVRDYIDPDTFGID